MKEKFKKDFYRIMPEKFSFMKFLKYFRKYHQIRFLYFYRHQNFINKKILKRMKRKYGLEIDSNKIGEGLYLGHPYGITVNKNAVIGKNCNLHKGATIGQENRGKRKGYPTIGNSVYIGINSTIVGNITIGDNVLIASNAFVNCDVPANSVVFGNPCVIKENEFATKDYIINTV